MKVLAKEKAIELRKAGHSYNYIAPQIGVSKSTLGIWLADVSYTPNLETLARIGNARAASGAAKSRIKRESMKMAMDEARIDIGSLSKRDLFMLGLGLYIGEGMKSTQSTRFTNSNPAIMKIIIRWFIEALDAKQESMKMRLHLYPDSDEEMCLKFWSSLTGIPHERFYKSVIDRRDNKRVSKSGKLPYGTAHLTVTSLGDKRFGVFLARKIMAWSDIVLGTKDMRD